MEGLGFGPALAIGRGRLPVWPVFDFTGGALPWGASLTRSSAGTRFDAAGHLVNEAANVARFDHDRATGALRGLLIEPARTNLCPNANADPADTSGVSAFGGGMVSVASDAAAIAAAGLGVLAAGGKAYKLDNSAAGSASSFAVTGATTSSACVGSAWLRGSGGAAIGFSAGTASMATTALTADYTRYISTITPSGSGYFRVTVAAGAVMWLLLDQLEAGTSETTPIVTTGAAATRAADVLTLDWASRGVADGTITARVTFDDLSTQDVTMAVAGGLATVPVTLTRRRVRAIARL